MVMRVTISPQGQFKKLIEDLGSMDKHFYGERVDKAMGELAAAARQFIVGGIVNQRSNWQQLSEITKRLKGHGRILIDSGTFMLSMVAYREGDKWYAGLPEGAVGDKGQDLEVVGSVHENGASVKVTDKIRNFFLAIGFPLAADTQFIVIPKRPWFAPAVEELEAHAPRVLEPMMNDIIDEIG